MQVSILRTANIRQNALILVKTNLNVESTISSTFFNILTSLPNWYRESWPAMKFNGQVQLTYGKMRNYLASIHRYILTRPSLKDYGFWIDREIIFTEAALLDLDAKLCFIYLTQLYNYGIAIPRIVLHTSGPLIKYPGAALTDELRASVDINIVNVKFNAGFVRGGDYMVITECPTDIYQYSFPVRSMYYIDADGWSSAQLMSVLYKLNGSLVTAYITSELIQTFEVSMIVNPPSEILLEMASIGIQPRIYVKDYTNLHKLVADGYLMIDVNNNILQINGEKYKALKYNINERESKFLNTWNLEGKPIYVGLFILTIMRHARNAYVADQSDMTAFLNKNDINDPFDHLAVCLYDYTIKQKSLAYDKDEGSAIATKWRIKLPVLMIALRDLAYFVENFDTHIATFKVSKISQLLCTEPYLGSVGILLSRVDNTDRYKDLSVKFGKSNYILKFGPYPVPREILYINPAKSSYETTVVNLYIALWE